MSSLSTDCRVCFVPVLYSQWDGQVAEGIECDTEEQAIEEAKEMIESHVNSYKMYCYVESKRRIVPLYK